MSCTDALLGAAGGGGVGGGGASDDDEGGEGGELLLSNHARAVDLFRAMDTNGDGKITRQEFTAGMRKLGMLGTPSSPSPEGGQPGGGEGEGGVASAGGQAAAPLRVFDDRSAVRRRKASAGGDGDDDRLSLLEDVSRMKAEGELGRRAAENRIEAQLRYQPKGATVLKRRQMRAFTELPLVHVPFWEWRRALPGNRFSTVPAGGEADAQVLQPGLRRALDAASGRDADEGQE